jgi:hypothetical protein
MIKIIEKATYKLDKVLLVDLLEDYFIDETDDIFDEHYNGGYAIYTHSELDGWTKQEYFKYEGETYSNKGWVDIYDNVALPRFKDYCLAMLSEMEN